MQSYALFLSSTVTGDGPAIDLTAPPPVTLQAWLGADGGTATCNVYGRVNESAPWVLLWTAGLSGASDTATYILDEQWGQFKGNISAISSATASIAGVA